MNGKLTCKISSDRMFDVIVHINMKCGTADLIAIKTAGMNNIDVGSHPSFGGDKA